MLKAIKADKFDDVIAEGDEDLYEEEEKIDLFAEAN